MALLFVERGPQKGRSVKVEQGRVVRVGRATDCDLILNDPLVSRHHFEVEGRDGEFYIRDLGSTNGTYLNGNRLKGEKKLQVGDRIEVGDCLLTLIPHERWRKHDTVTGQTVAGYLIMERIGRGGMGTVYKALQLSLDRTVALKILSSELCQNTKFVEMFVREARNAGQLNHPNIVHVYDVGKWRDVYYLSMEYMAGGSVADMIRKEKKIKPRYAIAMAIDAAKGLEYAEQRGIIHRDIKPANLMLTEDGTVKIGDLGIARRVPPGGTLKEERLWGSPLYMSPEQARCDKIDHRADIYSLGATMYHMLTGRPPFSGETLKELIIKQIKEKPPPLKEVAPDIPEPLCQVVEKMLEKDPEKRFQTASEVVEALEGLKSSVRVARPLIANKQVYKRLLWVVGVLMAVVVAALVLAMALNAVSRARKERLEKMRQQFVSSVDDIEAAWRKALAAQPPTPAERILSLRKRYKSLLAQIATLAQKYGELEGVKKRLDDLKTNITKRMKDELNHFEEQASIRLREAERFWEENKRSFNEAERLFLLVAKEYAGSVASKRAQEMARSVARAREAYRQRLRDAEKFADNLIKIARDFADKGEFRKARARLEMFPSEFADTPAVTRIKAEMAALSLKEQEALEELRRRVLKMLKNGKIDEASETIRENLGRFNPSGAETVFAALKKAVERERRKREEERRKRRLEEDAETLAGAWEKARNLCAKFQPDSAINTLRSIEISLNTERYRRLTKIAVMVIKTWKEYHNALIAAINSSSLRYSVLLKFGRSEGPVVAADKKRVFIRLGKGPQSPKTSQRWDRLSVPELLKLYEAMENKPQNELGLSAFFILRGMREKAASLLDGVADPALTTVVKCFKEFLLWLK